MKKSFCLIVMVLAVGASCSTTQPQHGIPNLVQVGPRLYRGGQPSSLGWAWLRSIGVTNVVKLNPESESSDADAITMGMVVQRFPISTAQQNLGGHPPRALLEAAVAAIGPDTYVHCEHGQDRTGLVVALWRMRQGWSKDQAQREMEICGFHPLLLGLSAAWEETR